MRRTDLVVVGAGPFGLAIAAAAAHQGIEHTVIGRPMSFWRERMPVGMLLRSASDWHLDVQGVATIDAFLATRGRAAASAEPLSRDLYLDYCEWFQREKAIEPLPLHVARLDRGTGGFLATLDDGSEIAAGSVALALGMDLHRRLPADLVELLPAGCWEHTCDAVDLTVAAGRRYLVVGGRQSAFEWAALLTEAGAASVDLVHRHPSPAFAAADWSWVAALVDGMVDDPGWFSRLPPAQQEDYRQRLYAEGRLKVEPWLQARLPADRVRVHAHSRLTGSQQTSDGALAVRLSGGELLAVDRVVLATGYQPRIDDIGFLRAGNLPLLSQQDGLPDLDDGFQTSVPGLYVTSLPATGHFGPFLGFTVATRMSATVITRAVRARGTAPVATAGD